MVKPWSIITQDFCTPLGNPEEFGATVMVTNSLRVAFYGPYNNGFDVWFANMDKCVDAAIKGDYED